MVRKLAEFCLALFVCIPLVAYTISPAKALLVDGSYSISLTGELIDPSSGTFDVVGGTVQNFVMELLSDGQPPNEESRWSSGSTLVTVPGGSMFQGDILNDFFFGTDNDRITFFSDFTWICAASGEDLCATSSEDIEEGDGGFYSISQNVSAVPLPAAAWMFLAALGALGVFARRRQLAAG